MSSSEEHILPAIGFHHAMDNSSSNSSGRGIAAFFLFSLGSIFIGPLEAVIGLVAYAIFSSSQQSDEES